MLDKKYNAQEIEKKWQDYWENTEIFKFDPHTKNKIFSIDTPPPTVSGSIHIGHVFSYAQVEMIARYFRMKGYEVFYPFGFDDNGLPTERLVEKQHKLKAKHLSREDFIKLCLKTTQTYEKNFKELFKSLGFSADWNLEYSTISENVQRISQRSFIDLYKKNKVYYKEAPNLWCPECSTAVAQAEIDTKIVPSTFNYLNFGLMGSDKKLLIATTRPELLYACVCVFVNPQDKKHKDLLNKKAIVPIFNFEVPILADEKVDMEKGSGIVMCCTFGDNEDIAWWRKYSLPLKKIITKNGKMLDNVPFYGGLSIKETRKKIVEDLDAQGYLIKKEDIEHSIAVHERCSTPIEFIVSKQWFIKIIDSKQKFLYLGEKINWHPNFMKHRYINWVENIEWDWGISRQRYYGVPFPVWYCSCGKVLIEDKDLPVNPIVDLPKTKCECGSTDIVPEYDVMDTWATSSLTPLINALWKEKQDMVNKMLPMSLRPNSHDIIRTWDFYTIVKTFYHLDSIPWENIMISGFVLAKRGEKFSKSKGNTKHSPEDLIKMYSADVIRYWAAKGKLGTDIVFSEDELRNGKRLVTKLWNSSKFCLMHLEDYEKKDNIDLFPIDKWILHKLSKYVKLFRSYMDKYEVGLALESLEQFLWYFCDNYIEIVKTRLYNKETYGEEARESGQHALYIFLFEILKLFSSFLPHVTEEIYQAYFKNIEKKESIHICSISEVERGVEEDLIAKGDFVVEVIAQVRKYKSEQKLSIKSLVKTVCVEAKKDFIDFLKLVECDFKNTCNTEAVEYKVNDKELIVKIN